MKIREVLFAIFTLFLSHSSFAGHEIGAVIITYESVAQVNNNNLQYVLNVYMFTDKNGALPPASVTINRTSSCFSNGSYTLPKLTTSTGGTSPLLGSDYCSTTNTIQNNYSLSHYRDTILLPGTCHNFKFSITAGFGRYSSMLNIANQGSYNNYFEVKLNNNYGPNSSPTLPVSEFFQVACINKPLNIYTFQEGDQDSVYYAHGAPQYISGNTIGTFGYSPGYSILNPINSASGYSLNPQTGLVQTQLGQIGNFLITINYAEYRYDTTSQQMKFVGGGQFSMSLSGTTGCNSAPFDMIHLPVANPDSLGCGDSIVKVATTRKIAASTLTSNGTEFTVLSKRAGTLTVSSATVTQDSIVELQFTTPIPQGDTLDVFAGNGSDGNVILSYCGKELLAEADTLRFFSPNSGLAQAAFNHSSSGLTAIFNSSGSLGSSYEWDFGDGSPLVTTANPSHTYSSAGVYQVTLVVSNTCGISDTSRSTVEVCAPLQPAFSFTVASDTVKFDAGNSSGVTSYSWNFGDGNTGTGATINHPYDKGGVYIVQLIASNNCGDTLIVTDTVKVCEAPLADWTYTVVSTTSSGMLVNFDGTASINAQRFLWDFGDGNTNNTTATPSHTYQTPSLNYMVSLTVYNECDDENQRTFRLTQIGLEEMSDIGLFNFYPNPVSDYLKVEWNHIQFSPQTISIYSMTGERVLHFTPVQNESLNGKLELDVSGLPAGFYLMELYEEGIRQQQKFMVK